MINLDLELEYTYIVYLTFVKAYNNTICVEIIYITDIAFRGMFETHASILYYIIICHVCYICKTYI